MINRLNQKFKDNGYNITTEQYRVLVALWNKDGQNQQELAQVTYKNKTSLARLINNLEKGNLVVRVPDMKDNRNRLIYLTRKGKEIPGELTRFARETLMEAQAGIPGEELEICKKVLKKVIGNLSG